MANVTVPIRIEEEEYQKYRIRALKERKSFAQLVRELLKRSSWDYNENEKQKIAQEAAGRILKIKKIKPHKPLKEMIEEGRKY